MFARSVASNLLRSSARPAAAMRLAPAFALRASVSPFAPLTPFQARLLSEQTRSAIDKAVASAPVVLFMKGTPETPQCGFSRAAIQILGLQGVNPEKFAAFNVLEDPELRAGIKEYSDWPTIPQLYVNKEFIGGTDILVSMHQNGDLAKLFEDSKVLFEGAPESESKE
ncbi:thioredoxin-like protein [Mariannaea sp. PMI_226]|nr:thioredoxin-like protein [Mariannaea sp. PMI_226]